MVMITKFLSKRKANLDFLRRVADQVGREIETWPYDKLSQPVEVISFSREINSATVFFSLEAYEKNTAGDLHICVDVKGSIPTFPYLLLPSYVFWKRVDGSVYY